MSAQSPSAEKQAPNQEAKDPVLEACNLKKTYGQKTVVHSISLRCFHGQVLGLLGPNGAGKTTTLRMLYGFIDPSAGTIHYEGRSFAKHRKQIKRDIGVCTQDDTLDHDLTVEQNLRTYASYFRPLRDKVTKRVEELLQEFDLADYRSELPKVLSGGYKQRLLIARSVIHRPHILFLDEPTTGLDPKARFEVWSLINNLRASGMAIILTTHYMEEAERLTDKLLVLREGREAAQGKPNEVLGHLVGEHILVVQRNEVDEEELQNWSQRELGRRSSRVLNELRIAVRGKDLARFEETFPNTHMSIRPPSLDDLFLLLGEEV